MNIQYNNIKKIYDRIFKYKPTDVEEQLAIIISDIIDNETTDKIMASDGKSYFSNKSLNMQVCFDGSFITIIKDNNCFEYCCNGKFSTYIDQLIGDKINDGIDDIKDRIYNAKHNILENIKQL